MESKFFNSYQSNHCISFDYDPPHDFPSEAIANLLQLVSNHGGHCPFSIFDLGSFTPATATFLETCAPSITKLRLAHWGYRDHNFFTEGVPKNLNFSALNKLDIKLIIDDNETCNIKNFFAFVAEIFNGSPSLQELSCTFTGKWGSEAMEEMLRSLAAVGDNGLLDSLKCLKLTGCFLPTQFLILSALDTLHLEKLTLKFCCVSEKTFPNCIKRFLQSQSCTLEILHLGDKDCTSKCAIIFPRMEKLKTLKISGSKLAGMGMTFEDIEYSIQFPILENLSLIRVGGDEWNNFAGGSTLSSLSLKRLQVKDSGVDGFHFTNAGKAKIKMIFPNLEELLHE